jgi:hypothetical protein
MKLKLPADPFKFGAARESLRKITGGYNIVKPEEVLNDQVMDTFATWSLTPKFVSLFGRNDQDSKIEDRMIHADVAMNRDGATWRKLIFGINWEIEQSENIFSWWDMSALKECWPDEQLGEFSKYKILNGIHYVNRGFLGIPDLAVKLDETVISGPTAVRTEIPHMTLYTSPTYKRLGISVRFDESKFNSWSDVVELLKPHELS